MAKPPTLSMNRPVSRAALPRFAAKTVDKSVVKGLKDLQARCLENGVDIDGTPPPSPVPAAARATVGQGLGPAPAGAGPTAALRPLVPAEGPASAPAEPADRDPALAPIADAHARFKQYTANSNQFVGGHTDHYRHYVHAIDEGGLEANCAARGMFALAAPLSKAPVATHPPKTKSASATPGDSLYRKLCAAQEDMIDQHFRLLLWFSTPDTRKGVQERARLETSLKQQIEKRFNFTDINTFCTLFSVQLFNRVELLCKAMVEAPPSQTRARAQELLGKIGDFQTDLIWAHMLIKDAARTVKDDEIRSTLVAYADSFARMEALLSDGDGLEKGEFQRLAAAATRVIQRTDEPPADPAVTRAPTPEAPGTRARQAKRSLSHEAARKTVRRLDPEGLALQPLSPGRRGRANAPSRPARSP